MSRLRGCAAAALVALAAALGAAPALAAGVDYTMVPGHELGGLQLGWTPAQVIKRLGKPSYVSHKHGKVVGYEYLHDGLNLAFATKARHDPLTLIEASGGPFKTIKGIHVGMSETALKKALRSTAHVTCTKGGCAINNADYSVSTNFNVLKHKVIGFSIYKAFGS